MPRSLTCKSAVRMPEWRVAEQFLCLSDILLFLGGLVNLNKKKKKLLLAINIYFSKNILRRLETKWANLPGTVFSFGDDKKSGGKATVLRALKISNALGWKWAASQVLS